MNQCNRGAGNKKGAVLLTKKDACTILDDLKDHTKIYPIFLMMMELLECGGIAQLGEHSVRNAGVEGSNPFASTNEFNKLARKNRALIGHWK